MLDAVRFASGASPTPRWRDTRRTTRLLKFKKEGVCGIVPARARAAARSRSDHQPPRRAVRRRH